MSADDSTAANCQDSKSAECDLDEQREIVAILEAIDRKLELHRGKRMLLGELFEALVSKLLSGDIRVADLDLSVLAPIPATAIVA